MIALQDHIEELRAELRGCLNRRERARIAAELEAAIAALKEQDRAAEANRATRMKGEATMCKVLNVRRVCRRPAPDRVYVGHPSKWGNLRYCRLRVSCLRNCHRRGAQGCVLHDPAHRHAEHQSLRSRSDMENATSVVRGPIVHFGTRTCTRRVCQPAVRR
jgi:hypothetical protein